jgi:hypothetical protein
MMLHERPFDAIFLGAVGHPSVPDHVSLVNLRPVRPFENISPLSNLSTERAPRRSPHVEIEGCGHRPCRRLNLLKNRTQNLLLLPFAASFFCNFLHIKKLWRRRVGVEPTIRSAKGRIGGFEGRDSHRTIFASG